MSNRLADQPAVLEWFPTQMRTVRPHQPNRPIPQRMSFETVEAAVTYATTKLTEAYRRDATIKTAAGITLGWADIEAMSKAWAAAQ